MAGLTTDQQSFGPAAVRGSESHLPTLIADGPFSESRPAGFRGVYPLLPKIRKATPTLMRGMGGRVWHEPMPATACSAGLRCHRSRDTRLDRSLADDVEAVFVLIGVRRFAQSAENHRQRADSGDEKACNYDHDIKPSKICAIISRFDSFVPQAILRFSIRGIRTSGVRSAN